MRRATRHMGEARRARPARRERTMADRDPIAAFFEELTGRGLEPLVGNVKGTVRFEVVNGSQTERWALLIDEGRLAVSRGDVEAQLVVRGSRSLLEQVVRGR